MNKRDLRSPGVARKRRPILRTPAFDGEESAIVTENGEPILTEDEHETLAEGDAA